MNNHLYIIGIGGVGTVWIADWALRAGWQVSGSDIAQSAATERLQAAGANIHYGADSSKIPEGITEVVINSAITPTSPSYPELQEVERRKLSVSKRAVYIGKITRQHFTIAVAGTHGKTTTTAMIGWILSEAGLDPTVFVGGSLAAWEGKTPIGKSKYLVIEADEFDRSFHNFSANMAVVLNIDADHLDYYKGGLPEISHSFRRFLRNLPPKEGLVVGYGRDKVIRQVTKGFAYKFRWYDEKKLWPGLKLQMPGLHNSLNATAAARIAHELGIEQAVIKKALASFPGVGRRFERLGQWHKAVVYDDYAHHPREIAATLEGARQKFGSAPLTVIFQPHHKARTALLLKEFGRAFDFNSPNTLIIAPIYEPAGRTDGGTVTNADIAKSIGQSFPNGMQVKVADTNEEVAELAEATNQKEGFILMLGAGNMRNLMEGWMKS